MKIYLLEVYLYCLLSLVESKNRMGPEEKIKEAFDPFFNVPLEAWRTFTALGEVISVSRNEVIKPTESREKYLNFILQGSGGILLWSKNNFVCIDLCYEGEFFCDYMSFLNQTTSPLEVITFEPTELFRIHKNNFDKISNTTEFGNKICRFAAEALYIHKQEQQINILTKTASERYLELQKKHAQVILRTPQKYVASYLGITPQSLSRIRKEQALKPNLG